MINRFSKYQVATFIAILFHIIGFTGILFINREFFIRSTPFHIGLMMLLLIWTQANKNASFLFFSSICIGVGIVVEIIGVNSSLLFGEYNYGEVLGIKFQKVPLLIGINWFIIIYCCGISVNTLFKRISGKTGGALISPRLHALSIIIDGAILAVFFDWVMEPVAGNLGYWQWNGNGSIPWFNYLCWFMISAVLLTVFHLFNFEKRNKFAVNLLLIQTMFFLLLRTFLP